MKIKHVGQYGTFIYEVVGIYWGLRSVGFGQDEHFTMFCCIRLGSDRIHPLYVDDVEILDATLKGEWVFDNGDIGKYVFDNGDIKAIFYAPLTRDNLLYDVLDRKLGALDKLWGYVRRDALRGGC